MTLNHLFEKTVADYPDQPALIHSSGRIDWKTLHEAVRRFARGLQKLGVERGDHVGIMLPNVPHFFIAYYAALRLGAIPVPINTLHKGRETINLLEDSETRVLIVWEGHWLELCKFAPILDLLKHVIVLGEAAIPGTLSLTRLIAKSTPLADILEGEGEDAAVIEFTAGVTGAPKGVILTHNNIISNVTACREVMSITAKDVLLAAVPLFHPVGQTLLMHTAVVTGAALELHPKFDPERILKSIQQQTCSLFPAFHSMFKILLDSSAGCEFNLDKPIRLSISAGGTLADELLKDFEARFKTYILECYTITETSPVISFNQWRAGRRVGSLGHPIPGVEMKVVNDKGEEVSIGEVGEIVVKGSNVMRGYINRPRSSAEAIIDGWFYTGDLGKMDINGFFYLVDRLHYRIMKGGFSIYPSEVEEVLYGHPDVAETAVIPIPDEVMGQDVKACVVLKEGALVTTEQLANYCRERMAVYKVPAIIRIYKDLPHCPSGRINKAEIM
ncbi:MAG: AMP-binding protein [Calditrichota bacterium]